MCVALAVWIVMLSALAAEEPAKRPNILIIMADDLGYSDLGCYGGEIETPVIDSLAQSGLRFTHFRATPMCATTRIALMAGMPMKRAGADYRRAMPLPIALKQAGYRTMMVGKWHAGTPDPRSSELFDRSFGFLGGMTDSFVGSNDWFQGKQPFDDFDSDFYSTTAFAQRASQWMRQAADEDQPFLMYVAFNAPHHPCQAPRATVEKYAGRYDAGYEAVRSARHQNQVAMGIVDEAWPMAPLGGEVRRWDQLSDHRRSVEAGRMEAYAATVDEVDRAVGGMLDTLDEAGIADDTLVVFLSDNGGDYSNGSIRDDQNQVPWKPGHNPSSSNGWAAVKATPFRFYKHASHEGGVSVPMIVRWPAGVTRPAGSLVRSPASITDFYPTLMELVGAEYPETFGNRTLAALTGSSLVPLMQADRTREAPPVWLHYNFSRAWVQADWKAVSLYDGPWQLFDLKSDRGETRDLAATHPERLQSMVDQWIGFATDTTVINPSMPMASQQAGWGWHRLQMVCPSLVSMVPANGSTIPSDDVPPFEITFRDPIDFRRTAGKSIQLYEQPVESEPIWTLDASANHPAQGKRVLRLDGIPDLKPGHEYFFLWDPGWVRPGGRPVGTLNDGAFWWRFRTSTAAAKPAQSSID